MKLLKEILIGTAVAAALSTSLAFGDDVCLIPNNHGSYSFIGRRADPAFVALSVSDANGSMGYSTGACAGAGGCHNGLRDNAHGQEVTR